MSTLIPLAQIIVSIILIILILLQEREAGMSGLLGGGGGDGGGFYQQRRGLERIIFISTIIGIILFAGLALLNLFVK